MKKVLIAAIMLFAVAGTTMAQTDKDKTEPKKDMPAKKHHPKHHHHHGKKDDTKKPAEQKPQ